MLSKTRKYADLLDSKDISRVLVAISDRNFFLSRVQTLLNFQYNEYATEDYNNMWETPQVIEHSEIETVMYSYARDVLHLLKTQCWETPTMIRVPYFILHQILNVIIIENTSQLRLRPETHAIEVCVSTGRRKKSRNFPTKEDSVWSVLVRALIFRQEARNARDKQRKNIE